MQEAAQNAAQGVAKEQSGEIRIGGFMPDRKLIAGLISLSKPGIVALCLVATSSGLYIGGGGAPDTSAVFWALLGMAFSTAGSATLNNFLDRDIDSVMTRTQKRSLPSGSVTARQAYLYGTFMVTMSLIVMQITLGTLVTVLTGLAAFIYVVLYSLHFKRKTPLATHVGGIAGAMPPLIGYAAACGTIDTKGLVLFLIIVVWQQPHFWALALKYLEDYGRAGVPTLPVARGVDFTKRKLMIWTVALLPVSVLPYYVNMSGKLYLATAIVMTAAYIGATARFVWSGKDRENFLFFFSIVYLTIVFGMLVIDMV